jgi:RNA polymerase sigma factor (sigma-70 family)
MAALSADHQRDVEAIVPYIRVVLRSQFRSVPTHVEQGDLLQAAMEAVCKARPRFDPNKGATWPTYAAVCAVGGARDYLRDQRPGSRAYPADAPLSLEQQYEDRSLHELLVAPDDGHEQREILRLVEVELDRMSGSMAAAFRLVAYLGYTLREVAEMEGVTESAIGQRMIRARRRLKPIAQAA